MNKLSIVVDGVKNRALGDDESLLRFSNLRNQLCTIPVNKTSIKSLASKLIEDRCIAWLGIAWLTKAAPYKWSDLLWGAEG